jgi:hypothetical protein
MVIHACSPFLTRNLTRNVMVYFKSSGTNLEYALISTPVLTGWGKYNPETDKT